MAYKGALIAVTDMEQSRRFYCELLNMEVAGDFGANVQLSGGLFLQTVDSWRGFIGNRDVLFHANAGELYFEAPDMDAFLQKLAQTQVTYVHAPLTHDWGQRAVRFFDPDGHIIEVAEALTAVIKRFVDSGMTPAETARRMDVPEAYVLAHLNG